MSGGQRCLSALTVDLEERVMGKVADEAITARRRRRRKVLVKVAATHPAADAAADQGDRRRRSAVASVRRAVRTQRLAREAISCAEEQAATSIRLLADQGLPQSQIAALCCVPLWTVRRLIAVSQPTSAGDSGDNID
jgi:DNA-directed RNA polymerase specialized sigma24 family protein